MEVYIGREEWALGANGKGEQGRSGHLVLMVSVHTKIVHTLCRRQTEPCSSPRKRLPSSCTARALKAASSTAAGKRKVR